MKNSKQPSHTLGSGARAVKVPAQMNKSGGSKTAVIRTPSKSARNTRIATPRVPQINTASPSAAFQTAQAAYKKKK